MANSEPKLSIIIPFFNEAENAEWVISEVKNVHPDAEIIAVDDGSTDKTKEKIKQINGVNLLSFSKNLGQSAALYAGISIAKGEICALLDGDGQNDPSDIGKMIEKLAESDLVCGWRKNRKDTFARKMAGLIGNSIRILFLGKDGVQDTTCTLKVFKKTHAKHFIPFNGLHRYIPIFFVKAGLKVIEMPVNHRPRIAGKSKYGILDRAWRGIFDLIGVKWLLNRKINFHGHKI